MRESGGRDKIERSERTLLDPRTMTSRDRQPVWPRREWSLVALSVIGRGRPERDRHACGGPASDGCCQKKREECSHLRLRLEVFRPARACWLAGHCLVGKMAPRSAYGYQSNGTSAPPLEGDAPNLGLTLFRKPPARQPRSSLSVRPERHGELEDGAPWRIRARPQPSAVSLDDSAADR